MIGIEILKRGLKKLIDFANELGKALEDGKLKITEIVGLTDEAWGLAYIYKNWQDIREEYSDLTEQERAEIVQYLSDELDLPNKKIEQIIEDGFDLIFQIWKFIKTVRNEG